MALKTWESTFEPLLDASQWPDYNGDDYVPNCGLLKQKVGRRKRKRLRNEMDDSSKGYGEDMYGAGDFDEAPIKFVALYATGWGTGWNNTRRARRISQIVGKRGILVAGK
jgi:hypothetical protein